MLNDDAGASKLSEAAEKRIDHVDPGTAPQRAERLYIYVCMCVCTCMYVYVYVRVYVKSKR